jgi:hypothetical protein
MSPPAAWRIVKQQNNYRLERYNEPYWSPVSQHRTVAMAEDSMRARVEEEQRNREWEAEAVQFDADGRRI